MTNIDRQAGSGGVVRHKLIDRLYHWIMAIAVVVLAGSAFLPILGIKFEWLTIHWIAGLVLAASVLFHIIRAIGWQDRLSMMIDAIDLRNGWRRTLRVFGRKTPPLVKASKYNGMQKLFHLGTAVVILAIIGSGLLMLLKIDTPWWRRDPYWFDDGQWGVIYSVHGFSAMLIVSVVMIHIYFALRPDEWHLLRSMFRGWISDAEYRDHHDAGRWKASDKA